LCSAFIRKGPEWCNFDLGGECGFFVDKVEVQKENQ